MFKVKNKDTRATSMIVDFAHYLLVGLDHVNGGLLY